MQATAIDRQPGILSADEVDSLFAELRAQRVLSVSMRAGKQPPGRMSRSTLEDAQRALRTGRACAVQIRTIKDDEVWNDILIASPGGVRRSQLSERAVQRSR